MQGRSQTLNLRWAREEHFLIFPNFFIIFSQFSSFSSSIKSSGPGWVSKPPTCEGPGYTTEVMGGHLFVLPERQVLKDCIMLNNSQSCNSSATLMECILLRFNLNNFQSKTYPPRPPNNFPSKTKPHCFHSRKIHHTRTILLWDVFKRTYSYEEVQKYTQGIKFYIIIYKTLSSFSLNKPCLMIWFWGENKISSTSEIAFHLHISYSFCNNFSFEMPISDIKQILFYFE